ncbi:MAG: hypothetical protein R2761_03880, partial [Acidimicrobiales bacterium]
MDGETSVRQEDSVGGRNQPWHWALVAFSVLLIAFGSTNLWLGWRDDRRVSALRADLTASFAETTSTELLAGVEPRAGNQMYLGVPSIADLTTTGGVAPDLITADGRSVQARYVVGSIRGARCVVATWTEAT